MANYLSIDNTCQISALPFNMSFINFFIRNTNQPPKRKKQQKSYN